MSSLTDFVGGGIKSVQRGTITVLTTATATVSAVNTAKSVLHYLGITGIYVSASWDGPANARIALTNSTTITATGLGYTNVDVSYELVEYY
jgi:hypothetical protein